MLGIDLGTTATKVVAVDTGFEVTGTTERGYPLRTGPAGEAEQDPAVVLAAALDAIGAAVTGCRERGERVAGLSFSAALHTLLAVDRDGEPSTPALSWADTRGAETAARLRRQTGGALHRATGTPVHPMSPLVKLAWFAEHEPDLHRAAHRWCGLKDLVLWRFTGRLVTDLSCASATGLLDLRTLDWHPEALRIAGIRAADLPDLVAPIETFALSGVVAERLGLPAGLSVVAGAGDGPLANLSVGAVRPGTAALSVGTSAALRVAGTEPAVDQNCSVFCYALADGLWVLGGAISNGGVVAQWAAELFGPVPITELLAEAARAAPGAGGLIAVPHLLGERAPWWDAAGHGALVGLRREHGRPEVMRALVEGVGHQLAMVRDAILATGTEIDEIRATGGAFRAPLWADVLAAALHTELRIGADRAGSGFGAALLGWRALGGLATVTDVAGVLHTTRTVAPDPVATQQMASVRTRVDEVFRAIRALD